MSILRRFLLYTLLLPWLILVYLIPSVSHAFQNDGSWESGYYWRFQAGSNKGIGPTREAACNDYGLNYWENNGSPRCGAYSSGFYKDSCAGTNYPVDQTQCDSVPVPPEPTSCQDLADNYPNGVTVEYNGGYQLSFCEKGCIMTDTGTGSADFGSYILGDYAYTGGECNGGFNLDSDIEPIKDLYAHDQELKNCYDAAGVLLGQISVDLSCPPPSSISVCYDPNTNQPVGTTSAGSACAVGVKFNETSMSLSPVTSETTTVNPDGTTTVTKETSTTQTGLDGSKSTTYSKTSTSYDANGTELSSETTTSETNAAEGVGPGGQVLDLPKTCKTFYGTKTETLGKKVSDFKCEGDIFQCLQIQYELAKQCALSEGAFDDFVTDPDNIEKFGVGTDENGVLGSLDKGEINLTDSLNLDDLGDSGSIGACPPHHQLGLLGTVVSFKYDTICQFADAVRPLIIFSSIFICMVMVRRSIVGG